MNDAAETTRTRRPATGPGIALALAWCALLLLVGHGPARAADLGDFRSPVAWDGRLIQPDGLYAVTVPPSWKVVPLDERSFHAHAPDDQYFFVYMTVAPRQADSLDGLLDTLMELPKKEMKGFKELARKPFTQDGHKGKTLQAEENDGAWNKVFYAVLLTDTHQYLLRTACRLDRFPEAQPLRQKILKSLYVGGVREWKRKNTHAVEDPQGRYSAAVPPGWKVERGRQGMKAQDPKGTSTISVTVRDRTHRSLQDYSAALAEALKEQYPGNRIGSPMATPEIAASNQAAKSMRVVIGGPEGNKFAHVYAVALNQEHEFLLEGAVSGMKGKGRQPGASRLGSLVGLWHVHLRPE